eukprot:scaffold624_cov402-Prasinococcus_capsulatus_cf.AAC.39
MKRRRFIRSAGIFSPSGRPFHNNPPLVTARRPVLHSIGREGGREGRAPLGGPSSASCMARPAPHSLSPKAPAAAGRGGWCPPAAERVQSGARARGPGRAGQRGSILRAPGRRAVGWLPPACHAERPVGGGYCGAYQPPPLPQWQLQHVDDSSGSGGDADDVRAPRSGHAGDQRAAAAAAALSLSPASERAVRTPDPLQRRCRPPSAAVAADAHAAGSAS